jgi:hypothetical protein
MEIIAAKKPTTDVQEFKNLEFRFKRGGEQVQASEHTENIHVHGETQMLHNKWKEKQVQVQKKKKTLKKSPFENSDFAQKRTTG